MDYWNCDGSLVTKKMIFKKLNLNFKNFKDIYTYTHTYSYINIYISGLHCPLEPQHPPTAAAFWTY